MSRKLRIRRSGDRGRADHGWLQARFTFSFAGYHDPDHMGFRTLRVMNNDTIAPGGGFPTHPHRDMEIFTYVIEGELEHKDSMGNGSVIKAGDLQYMSAGSGVSHSELNPSADKSTHIYQIWIEPRERGGEPCYAEKPLGPETPGNALVLLFSGDGREGSTPIRQNAEIHFGRLDAGRSLQVPGSETTPHAWVQVVSGDLTLFGENLQSGDGIAMENVSEAIDLRAAAASKFLVFRLD